MPQHDFSSLSDQDFESLSCDILSRRDGNNFERFKKGRDGGVDGRYFSKNGGEVILQCKHWAKSGLPALLRSLENVELMKIQKLAPERYILCTSVELSRSDKSRIRAILSPYVKREDDILGQEDLNDLLGRNPEIESRHYKLWLRSEAILRSITSSAIRGRSQFTLSELHSKACRYVHTASHSKAIEKLHKNHVVLITGAPGVGKTTLAEQLCLESALNGFQLCVAAHQIEELEYIYLNDEKQIFYFDDFLGRNFLEALERHEDSRITAFIKRVQSDKRKRFVLTSRSTVLNRGKSLTDLFSIEKIDRHELELKVEHLSDLEKARILHSCIWYSNLEPKYTERIIGNKNYRRIISHKNFNPRLITFVTDQSRLTEIRREEYIDYILSTLQNPADVWSSVYESHLTDSGRAILNLVAFNGAPIEENELRSAYACFLQKTGANRYCGNHDFDASLRMLVGSVLNRSVNVRTIQYSIFNPSIGDFLLHKIGKDLALFHSIFSSLKSTTATRYLGKISQAEVVSNEVSSTTIQRLMESAINEAFNEDSIENAIAIATIAVENATPTEEKLLAIEQLLNNLHTTGNIAKYLHSVAPIIFYAHNNGVVTQPRVNELLHDLEPDFEELNCDQLLPISELASLLPSDQAQELRDALLPAVVAAMQDSIDQDIQHAQILDEFYDVEKEDEATRALEEFIESKLNKFRLRNL